MCRRRLRKDSAHCAHGVLQLKEAKIEAWVGVVAEVFGEAGPSYISAQLARRSNLGFLDGGLIHQRNPD